MLAENIPPELFVSVLLQNQNLSVKVNSIADKTTIVKRQLVWISEIRI